ncbi:MAG: hypothetical protein ACFFDI_07990 [Promethearchaeota archaeon]
MADLRDIPTVLATKWYYSAMITTINYIVKFELEKKEAEQSEIIEKAFNNFLYGVRI